MNVNRRRLLQGGLGLVGIGLLNSTSLSDTTNKICLKPYDCKCLIYLELNDNSRHIKIPYPDGTYLNLQLSDKIIKEYDWVNGSYIKGFPRREVCKLFIVVKNNENYMNVVSFSGLEDVIKDGYTIFSKINKLSNYQGSGLSFRYDDKELNDDINYYINQGQL